MTYIMMMMVMMNNEVAAPLAKIERNNEPLKERNHRLVEFVALWRGREKTNGKL